MARLSRINNKASVRQPKTLGVQIENGSITKPFSALQHIRVLNIYNEQHMDKIKRNGSTTRWRKIRLAILKRDNYTCYYCGIPTATTCDHLTPVEQGGTDNQFNLVASCANCNYSKGNRTEEQYIKDRNRKHRSKIMKQNQFFEHDKTPPTPAMFISPKGLKSPFQRPEEN